MRGLFITGTDTGVGKTVLSASLLAAIVASGGRAHAHKPIVTGVPETADGWPADGLPAGGGPDDGLPADGLPADEWPADEWPADHVLLGQMCGMPAEQVAPRRYQPAVSPHLAAALAGRPIAPEEVIDSALIAVQRATEAQAHLIVEGVGGLLVPLTEELLVRDLASQLGLPLLIAARATLGTINHTLMTIEAARTAGLAVRAVVLTPWPDEPDPIMRSNMQTIASHGQVQVATLPHVSRPCARELAAAGATLPWRDWL